MQYSHILKKITISCVVLLLWSGVTPPAAMAGRYVLDQTPQTIQRYFGRPIAQSTERGDKNTIYTVYTYSSAPIRRLFPFPKAGQFKVKFVDNRATSIQLMVNAGENEYFDYGQAEATKFFNYIFGYQPPIWKPIPLPFGGGGHEGFIDNKACLGDGVATFFISYRLGQDNISLQYDRGCEPPYEK